MRATYDISKELAKRGHEIEVFTTNAYDQTNNFRPKFREQTLDGFKVTYFNNLIRPDNLFFSSEMIVALQKRLKGFDLVHTHFGRQAHDIAVGCIASRYGVPYVLQARGDLPRIMAKQRLKLIYDVFFGCRLLSGASKVIALSKTEAQQCKVMGVAEDKIAIIPNGIDLLEYTDLPLKGSFRKKFNIDNDEKIILYLGRIHRIKGIDILLKSFARLGERARAKYVRLVIAGPDDGYLATCRNLARQLKVEERVLFTGALFGVEKLEAYVDADVFVLPSRYEIFGNVVLESYACSKPVVASSVGGLREIVFHGKTGLLIKPGDVMGLCLAICTLLNDDKTRTCMGMQARKVVEEEFSIEKVTDKLEATYSEILGERERA